MSDYVRLGLLIGAAVALVGHFATKSGADGGHLLIIWLVVGAGVGVLVGLTLHRAAGTDTSKRTSMSGRTMTGELPAEMPTVRKFYAVSREPSSTELRSLLVDAPAIPGNPIGSRLQLIVERYDAYARVALTEGSLLEYPLEDLEGRAREQATDHAPVSSLGLDFKLTYFRSEGPLSDNGRSPSGWTFVFVDGEVGIKAEVLITATDILLIYRTAVSYPKTENRELLSSRKALAAAKEAFPKLKDEHFYLRANPPTVYNLFVRSPLWFAALDDESGEVLGPDLLPPFPTQRYRRTLTVKDLLALLRSDEDSYLKAGLLKHDPELLRDTGKQLFNQYGPPVVDELTNAIRGCVREGSAGADTLLHITSRVPSGLAVLALHQLAGELEGETRDLATGLFDQRRRQELDIFPDPIEPLLLEVSMSLMGRGASRQLPLHSTFDPETDLLPPLEAIGLRTSRVRLLSGDTELFLSAVLTTSDKLTEALLSSSPLPIPCHILRIVGDEANTVADLVEASELCYSEDEIVSDALGGRPTSVHRAAIYIAALGLDRPEIFDAMTEAIDHHKSNVELRKACIAALVQLTHPDVSLYLESLEDPIVSSFAQDLLEKRESEKREERAKRAKTGAWELEE